MGLTLTVLGCCGSYPGPGGACSGYLVSDGTTNVWVDAGSGTLANLQRHLDLRDLHGVVLSHQHVDHWRDVESLYIIFSYFLDRTDVPVYAPRGMAELAYPKGADMAPRLLWHTVGDGDTATIGGLRFTFSRTDHGDGVDVLAMRIEGGGAAIGYTADTGPEWALSALGTDLDLALVEATFVGDQEGSSKHLSGRQAGATAKDARARRLVLTHLWPDNDPEETRAEAESTFGGPVEVAHTDACYDVAGRGGAS